MLIAVFFLDRSHATHRWIRLGPLSLQPSELAKLAVIFYLAWFIEMRERPREASRAGINDPLSSILPLCGTLLFTVGLILAEPGHSKPRTSCVTDLQLELRSLLTHQVQQTSS